MACLVLTVVLSTLLSYSEAIQDADGYINYGLHTNVYNPDIYTSTEDLETCATKCASDANCVAFVSCADCPTTCFHKSSISQGINTNIQLTSVYVKDSSRNGSSLYESCDDDVTLVCVDHTRCEFSEISSQKLCFCNKGYVAVPDHDRWTCYPELSTFVDHDCEDCITNGGACYDTNYDQAKDGCHCLGLNRDGVDCEDNHVVVKCRATPFTMTICYTPHTYVDFEDGAVMHVQEYGHKSDCVATVVKSDSECADGDAKLVLPLSSPERDTCDTQKITTEANVRYENQIYISTSFETPIIIKMYCSFATKASLTFNGVGINAVISSEDGHIIAPELTFIVKDVLNQPVVDDVPLRTGDLITLHLTLKNDGRYAALRAEYCMASTSHKLPDRSAETVQLISNGCPAPGQSLITDENTFREVNGQHHEQATDKFPIFKPRSSDVLFIHCTIILCHTGEEHYCAPADCSDSSRKKRKSDYPFFQNGNVIYSVKILDEIDDGGGADSIGAEEGSGGISVVSLCVGLLGIIMLLLAFVVLFTWKSKRTNKSEASQASPSRVIPTGFMFKGPIKETDNLQSDKSTFQKMKSLENINLKVKDQKKITTKDSKKDPPKEPRKRFSEKGRSVQNNEKVDSSNIPVFKLPRVGNPDYRKSFDIISSSSSLTSWDRRLNSRESIHTEK